VFCGDNILWVQGPGHWGLNHSPILDPGPLAPMGLHGPMGPWAPWAHGALGAQCGGGLFAESSGRRQELRPEIDKLVYFQQRHHGLRRIEAARTAARRFLYVYMLYICTTAGFGLRKNMKMAGVYHFLVICKLLQYVAKHTMGAPRISVGRAGGTPCML